MFWVMRAVPRDRRAFLWDEGRFAIRFLGEGVFLGSRSGRIHGGHHSCYPSLLLVETIYRRNQDNVLFFYIFCNENKN